MNFQLKNTSVHVTWEKDAEPYYQVDQVSVTGHVPDGYGVYVCHDDFNINVSVYTLTNYDNFNNVSAVIYLSTIHGRLDIES